MKLDCLNNVSGKVAAVTGGGGVLCGVISRALGEAGVKVAVLDVALEAAADTADQIVCAGGQAVPIRVDVTDRPSIETAADAILDAFGRVDVLINGAGGARSDASTSPDLSFFDLGEDALRWVIDVNLMGTVFCSQVFSRHMGAQESGCVINIASMAASRPLTRAIAYSAAKAGVVNFTQWLAVHLAQEYSSCVRVNAIAPGFFLTRQNRYLMVDEASGEPTERAKAIVQHTPMGRLGVPEDLLGTVIWLMSDAARFVTGAVIPVDGGFSAYSGV
jgi:NAD(P)-dependent dehydrogenase (short-subunit alcohol dehydrogenase family)